MRDTTIQLTRFFSVLSLTLVCATAEAQITPIGTPPPPAPGWFGALLGPRDTVGVELRAVFPGSPADQAGFVRGDVIVQINSELIESTQEFVVIVGSLGSAANANFWRAGASEAVAVTLGTLPPDFENPVRMLEGQNLDDVVVTRVGDQASVGIPDGSGRPTLIDFWATWCGPCVRAIPELEELRARYPVDQLEIISVSDEPAADVIGFLADRAMPWTVALDTDRVANEVYWITSYPTLVLLDGNGQIVEVATGAGGLPTIEAALGRLIGASGAP